MVIIKVDLVFVVIVVAIILTTVGMLMVLVDLVIVIMVLVVIVVAIFDDNTRFGITRALVTRGKGGGQFGMSTTHVHDGRRSLRLLGREGWFPSQQVIDGDGDASSRFRRAFRGSSAESTRVSVSESFCGINQVNQIKLKQSRSQKDYLTG